MSDDRCQNRADSTECLLLRCGAYFRRVARNFIRVSSSCQRFSMRRTHLSNSSPGKVVEFPIEIAPLETTIWDQIESL
jgi:hypothetical protein